VEKGARIRTKEVASNQDTARLNLVKLSGISSGINARGRVKADKWERDVNLPRAAGLALVALSRELFVFGRIVCQQGPEGGLERASEKVGKQWGEKCVFSLGDVIREIGRGIFHSPDAVLFAPPPTPSAPPFAESLLTLVRAMNGFIRNVLKF
jgi:hypothetical protein